ncbi:MAG: flagellar protein G [Euryarchaeota archaeon]|nr:flagellar protein G [Euryarchaeota archaeon]
MGLSTSATHIIFFIASVVIAGGFIGVAASVIVNITNGVQDRGNMIAQQLSEDFTVINDPQRMSNNPVVFYLKNTGKTVLSTAHITVLIDGVAVNSTVNTTEPWKPGQVIILTANVDLSSGDHVAKIILQDGLAKTFQFEV